VTILNSSHYVMFFSVSGLGYGIISGLFAMVNVLADITGPGSLGLKDDVPQNFLIVSGKLCKLEAPIPFFGRIYP
jgi:hypothetical protein